VKRCKGFVTLSRGGRGCGVPVAFFYDDGRVTRRRRMEMAYRPGKKAGGKSKLPVDSDGPRFVPGALGRTPHKVVQGRVGYTESKRMGAGKHGTKIPLPKGGP